MEHAWPQGHEESQDCGKVSTGMGSHGGLFTRNNVVMVRGTILEWG